MLNIQLKVLKIVCATFTLGFLFWLPASGIGFWNRSRRLANDDHYMDLSGDVLSLPLRCSTCALIGSSGHLLEAESGKEIDDHSCVLRIGFSPSRGWEKYVGSRTTARIVDSFSFFPFLKRPEKLVTGPYSADLWVVFDHRPGDISWFHRPMLSGLVQRHDSKFLWMTKKAEIHVREFLKAKMSSAGLPNVSGLWFAIKVAEDAGCSSISIYGVPDHQICKRNLNETTRSFYWENSSEPLCVSGVDSSSASTRRLETVSRLPTVTERKILASWAPGPFVSAGFHAPKWPS